MSRDLTGEVLDAIDAKRSELLQIVADEIGDQAKGSPRVLSYWRSACPQLTEPQLIYAAKEADWCRVFCLWALHQAGLGLDLRWEIGRGFEYRLPKTRDPQPGDLALWSRLWHGAFFVDQTPEEIRSIDGNQPGVCRRTRPAKPRPAFFSIEPLILQAFDLPLD